MSLSSASSILIFFFSKINTPKRKNEWRKDNNDDATLALIFSSSVCLNESQPEAHFFHYESSRYGSVERCLEDNIRAKNCFK